MPVDRRALGILKSTYWTSSGWRRKRQMPAPEDFEYARRAGLMFEPVELDHDGVVLRLKASFSRTPLKEVVEAFVSSLSSGRLDLRSALTSYVVGRAFPLHTFHQNTRANFPICSICGVATFIREPADWNRFSFERHRWGGVGIFDPYYITFDLEQFAAGDHPGAKDEDWQLTRDLLERIRTSSASDPDLRPGALSDALKPELPKSNRSQRRHLVMTLCAIGILRPRDYPAFRSGWVDFASRRDPPEWKSDWPYPSGFWRGADGLDLSAVREFFPRLSGLELQRP
jgi:hypothetical protein